MVTPSLEQAEIVAHARARESFRILAFAGTGKTTTLELIAHALAGERILYLVFNRAQATIASARFAALPNVKVMTAHGLAYRDVGATFRDRLTNDLIAERTWLAFISERGAFTTVEPDERAAAGRAVIATLKRFIASADRSISTAHVPACEFDAEFIAKTTRRLWLTLDSNEAMPITHDWYLKKYQLLRPRLDATCVLYDESQDFTASMLATARDQSNIQQIFCGDEHQQLYEFRGAVNALASIGLPAFALTETRRFGPEIAAAANMILAVKGEPRRIRGIADSAGITRAGYAPNPDIVLARTNAGLVTQALALIDRGAKIFIRGATDPKSGVAGSGAGELMSSLLAAFDLRNGRASTHPTFAGFRSWDDLAAASREDGGESLRPYVRLVETHANNVPRVVALIRDHSLIKHEEADVILSTVHRDKGEEHGIVSLAGDFRHFADDKGNVEIGEANVAYVAITRAMRELHYGGAHATFETSAARAKDALPLTALPAFVHAWARPSVPETRARPPAAKPAPRAFGAYVPGSRWEHPQLGTVTIDDATSQLIQVTTGDGEQKQLSTLLAQQRLTAVSYLRCSSGVAQRIRNDPRVFRDADRARLATLRARP